MPLKIENEDEWHFYSSLFYFGFIYLIACVVWMLLMHLLKKKERKKRGISIQYIFWRQVFPNCRHTMDDVFEACEAAGCAYLFHFSALASDLIFLFYFQEKWLRLITVTNGIFLFLIDWRRRRLFTIKLWLDWLTTWWESRPAAECTCFSFFLPVASQRLKNARRKGLTSGACSPDTRVNTNL